MADRVSKGKRTGTGRNPDPISAKKGSEIGVASHVGGPIDDLPSLDRSLLFAEISMLSYLAHDEAEPVFRDLGFTDVQFVERDNAEVYVLGDDDDVVVACRGTEPNEWNDIRADANAWTDIVGSFGRVHRGFNREVDDIWADLEGHLDGETRVVWFTGHSLGGAMATICAMRCAQLRLERPEFVEPREVITFGSPRVGNKRYVQHADVNLLRWVNNNDIVTRVPPTWLRYRHSGTRMYLDRFGDVRRLTAKQRAADRWAGFRDGLKRRSFDHFSDHAIASYVNHLTRAAGRTT